MIKRREMGELVNELRKSFLYQTPTPLYDGQAVEPRWLQVKMPVTCYARMMQLIRAAGGWNIPREERIDLLLRTEGVTRNVSPDGNIGYNLSEWAYDDLAHLVSELKSVAVVIPELVRFAEALTEEMKTRSIQ